MAWLGKTVTVFYDDMTQKVSVKHGIVKEENESNLVLQEETGTVTGLPWNRIIRIVEART